MGDKTTKGIKKKRRFMIVVIVKLNCAAAPRSGMDANSLTKLYRASLLCNNGPWDPLSHTHEPHDKLPLSL
jgi:hypothetical protein